MTYKFQTSSIPVSGYRMECSSSAVEDLTDLRSWVFWFLVNFLTESLVWALWIVLSLSCKSLFFYKSWCCLGVQCLTQPSPCHPPVLWHLQQCGNVCTEAAEAVWGTLGLAWPMIHVLPAVQLCNVPWGCQEFFLRYKSLKILTERISALDRGCDPHFYNYLSKRSGLPALAWESCTRCTLWNQECVRAYLPWFVSLCWVNIHWTHAFFPFPS